MKNNIILPLYPDFLEFQVLHVLHQFPFYIEIQRFKNEQQQKQQIQKEQTKQNKAKQKPTKRNNVIIKNYLLLALDLLEALLVLVNLSHPDRKPKQIHLVFCPIGIEIVISIKKHEGSDSNHDIFL